MQPRHAALLVLLAHAGCNRSSSSPPVVVTAGPSKVLELGTPVTSGAGAPGGIAAGTKEGLVLFAGAGGKARPLGGPGQRLHEGPVTALDLSPDGGHLLSGGGKTVVYWDTKSGEKVRYLRGPQPITTVALHPGGNAAFFGTDQGHVLRWRLDKQGADGIKAFSCGGAPVHPARMGLPMARRCPYGTYFETRAGLHICLYPVTHLQRSGAVLLRACRSGTLGYLDLKKQTTTFFQAGHLSAFASVGSDRVLLGRVDGKVQLFRRGQLQAERLFAAAGKSPTAVAAAGELLVVAAGGAIRLWHRDHATPVATLKTRAGRRVRWVGVGGRSGAPGGGRALRVLYDDGRVVARPLTVKPR